MTTINRSKTGLVKSIIDDKSCVVKVAKRIQHPFYKKYITRSKNYIVHTETKVSLNDEVLIAPSRKYSKLKSWRLVEVVKEGDQ